MGAGQASLSRFFFDFNILDTFTQKTFDSVEKDCIIQRS